MPCFQVRTPQERSAAVGSGAKSLTAATLQDAAGSDPISQQQKQNLQHRPGSATSVSHTDRKVQKRPLHNVNQKSQDEVNTKQKVFCQKFYQNIFARLMYFSTIFSCFYDVFSTKHKQVSKTWGLRLVKILSFGRPLEVLWKSFGSPLEVLWKSFGSPSEVLQVLLSENFKV